MMGSLAAAGVRPAVHADCKAMGFARLDGAMHHLPYGHRLPGVEMIRAMGES
jgi:hypothetical protein